MIDEFAIEVGKGDLSRRRLSGFVPAVTDSTRIKFQSSELFLDKRVKSLMYRGIAAKFRRLSLKGTCSDMVRNLYI